MSTLRALSLMGAYIAHVRDRGTRKDQERLLMRKLKKDLGPGRVDKWNGKRRMSKDQGVLEKSARIRKQKTIMMKRKEAYQQVVGAAITIQRGWRSFVSRRDAAKANGRNRLKTIHHFRKGSKRKKRRDARHASTIPQRRPRNWAEHKAQTIDARRQRALRMYGHSTGSTASHSRRNPKRKETSGGSKGEAASDPTGGIYSKLPPVVEGTVDTQQHIQVTADSTRFAVAASPGLNHNPLQQPLGKDDYHSEFPKLSKITPVENHPIAVTKRSTARTLHSSTTPLPSLSSNARKRAGLRPF